MDLLKSGEVWTRSGVAAERPCTGFFKTSEVRVQLHFHVVWFTFSPQQNSIALISLTSSHSICETTGKGRYDGVNGSKGKDILVVVENVLRTLALLSIHSRFGFPILELLNGRRI